MSQQMTADFPQSLLTDLSFVEEREHPMEWSDVPSIRDCGFWAGHRGNVVGNQIIITGGSVSDEVDNFCTTIRHYDTTTNTIEHVTPNNLPKLCYHASIIVPTKKILLYGGKNNTPDAYYIYNVGRFENRNLFF
jgi:N-acetylneuraminic acid mutarotase